MKPVRGEGDEHKRTEAEGAAKSWRASVLRRDLLQACGNLLVLLGGILASIIGVTVSWWQAPVKITSMPVNPLPEAASFNSEMDAELRQAWDEMDEGRIAYKPWRVMRQGTPEKIRVRISRQPEVDLSEGFDSDVTIERLRVSGAMAAYLSGKPGEFEIVSLSTAKQPLVGPFIDWSWEVTPLSPGTKTLILRAVATIRLSNGDVETKDIVVKESSITVEVDRVWATKRFIQDHWQWLLGCPLFLALLAWMASWVRSVGRKPRQAGF